MMAKIAVLVGIISMIMMQSVSGEPKINDNKDHDENAVGEQILISAHLKVKGYANDLADKDPAWAGQSDPYMEVVTTAENGHMEKKRIDTKGGTNFPVWTKYLEFSKQVWKEITVKILDEDGRGKTFETSCR